MAAARASGKGEVAVWLAGVAGGERPRLRRVGADRDEAGAERPLADSDAARAEPALTVAEVAAAVDAGRDAAAAAAADGITVLIASEPVADDAAPAISLIAALTGRDPGALTDDPAIRAASELALARHPEAARGPLHALRRLGTGEIAMLCGLALGAGEHGLGCVCDGLAALAGGAVAAAVEPALRPRLRAVGEHHHAALLGIAVVDGNELAAALD
jgi:NaMN:DMB phosphoribosyltransferase